MEYLMLLQQLRQEMPPWFNDGVLAVSEFSAGVGGIAVMALVYWCLSKRAGMLLMMNFSLAYVCNAFVKNILRVERPFIRDPRLVPYTPVTGYSFPSGHTMLATGFYGGLAVWQRRRKWLAGFFVLMALLTGFTRNWLGAHTPQDVIVGILLSCGVIAFNCALLEFLERTDKWDRVVLAAALAVCVLLYVLFPSSAKPVGLYAGVMLGWFLERRFIGYEIPSSPVVRAVTYVLGMAVVGVCYKVLLPQLLAPLGSAAAGGGTYFVTFLLVTAIWPGVMKLLASKLPA